MHSGQASQTSNAGGVDLPLEFTTLDDLIIRAVVDSVNGVHGAKQEDQLEDMVLEVMQLNGNRHQSYFHVGFFDGMLHRPYRSLGDGGNHSRQRWYAAGYVSALARRDQHKAILAVHEAQESVRLLGRISSSSDIEAARMTAPIVVQAFCRLDQGTAAVGFVSDDLIDRIPRIAVLLETEATRLLRLQRTTEARIIFDRLDAVGERAHPESPDWRRVFFRTVHRRRANCYRQLGEFETARLLLEPLSDLGNDDVQRHRVLVDLGLIASRYRNLADVKLPQSEHDIASTIASLELGMPLFERGLTAAAVGGGHAEYCIGIHRLLINEPQEAADLLERAYGEFMAMPEVY